MNLQFYRTLIAVAELESFSQAAKRLNMTLSAVSMQMKVLERELGVQIFDRAVRPPALTPLGRGIVEEARSVLAAQDKLVDLTQRKDAALQGEYRVGFIATASVRLLPGFLALATRQAPHVRFTVTTGLSESLQRQVADRQLDSAVVTRSDADLPNLTYTNLRTEDLVYALPKGLRGQTIKRCFEQRPFILFTPNSGIGRLVSNHLVSRGSRPVSTMILDSVEAIMECVNANIGFTALPRPDVERYAAKDIEILPMEGKPPTRKIALASAQSGLRDDEVTAMAELFAET